MIITGFNYIAAFLTFVCNLKCPYCITRLDGLNPRSHKNGDDWINFINNLNNSEDVPVTLQGGEPTLHPEFYKIINGIHDEISLNLMTNLQFNVKEFSKNISPKKFYRDVPFPAIRVSYHVGQMDKDTTLGKVKEMTDLGYSIGLYMLNHPNNQEEIKRVSERCSTLGIDFRLKEYLDRLVDKSIFKYNFCEDIPVKCKISDLIIGPDLNIYRCHHDLYTGKSPIPLPERLIKPEWTSCTYPTKCNPCDIKIKNNRYQNWGHCSVEIDKL